MAGELNFTAGIQVDATSIANVEKQLNDMIQRVASEGNILDQAFTKSLQGAQQNISTNANEVASNLERGAEEAKELADGLEDATDKSKDLKKNLDAEGQLNKLADAAKKFGIALGVEELIRKIITVRGEFQQLEIAFETMLGSSSKAKALMGQLTETAAKTPFDMQSIASGAKQLLAYGTASEEVNDTLVHLGDIAAGLSIPLNDLVYLYGTTMAQGRMFTQDLRQMQGRGIPIADEIARIMDVSKDAVPELVSAGEVTADVFQKAILAMSSEGGKFYQLMEKQSASLTGQISNLEDSFDQLLNTLGEQSQGVLGFGISSVAAIVDGLKAIAPILMHLVPIYGAYKVAVIGVTMAEKLNTRMKKENITVTKLQYVWTQLQTKAQKALNLEMLKNPWVWAAMAVAALAVGIYKLVTAESAEEQGIRKAREEHEKYQKGLQEEVDNAKGYISTLQDRTKSIEEQAEAWRKLNEESGAFEGYTMQEVQAMSTEQYNKILNDYKDKKTKEKESQDIEAAQKEVAKLKKSIEDMERTPIRMQGTDLWLAKYKDDLKKAEANLAELKKIKKEREDALAGGIDVDKIVKNKGYWEKIKSDAESALAALTPEQKGTDEWNTLVATIKDAEKQLQTWNLTEKDTKNTEEDTKRAIEERARVQKELNDYMRDSASEQEKYNSDFRIYALEQEIELTNDLNQKLKLQAERNKELLKVKKKQHEEDTRKSLKTILGEDEYANYVKKQGGDDTVKLKDDTMTVANQVFAESEKQWKAEEAKFYQEVMYDNLETKVDAYKDYCEDLLEIEQEKNERINEINADKDLTDEEKEKRIKSVEDNAQIEKAMLKASTGIGDELATEVANLVASVMSVGKDKIAEEITKVTAELDAQVAALTTESEGETDPNKKAEIEQKIVILTAQRNALIKQGKNLINQSNEASEETNEGAKDQVDTWQDVCKGIGDSAEAIGDTADMILNTVGGALSDTAKDALSAISSIAQFAQGAMQLISQTAQITDTTSKAMMASNIIGWIMMAVQLLVTLGTQLAQFSAENQLKKQIDKTKESVERLNKEYSLLEKQIKLEGNVGAKAYQDKIRLSKELNKTSEEQKKLLQQQYQLQAMQKDKYGAESDKVKETQDDILETQSAIADTEQQKKDLQKEIFEDLATTDLTSFSEDLASAMVDSFSQGMAGMKEAYNETVDSLILDMIKKKLSLRFIENLEGAFAELEKMTADGDLTDSEIAKFNAMLEQAEAENMVIAEQTKRMTEKLGLDEGANISSESKGFETLSQDTAEELNGRFTALQISGANIESQQRVAEEQRLLLSQQNIELIAHSRAIADQVAVSTQIAQNQLNELRDINANTAVIRSLDDRLRNIEMYTSKL